MIEFLTVAGSALALFVVVYACGASVAFWIHEVELTDRVFKRAERAERRESNDVWDREEMRRRALGKPPRVQPWKIPQPRRIRF